VYGHPVSSDYVMREDFFFIVAEHTFVSGFASIDFVKYSTTITVNV
jgi:hypothetical protein